MQNTYRKTLAFDDLTLCDLDGCHLRSLPGMAMKESKERLTQAVGKKDTSGH